MPRKQQQHTYSLATPAPPPLQSWGVLLQQGRDRFQWVERIREQAKECREQAKRLERAAREQEELADREVREALSQQAWEDRRRVEGEAAALRAVEEGLAHLELQEAPWRARHNRQHKTRHRDRRVRFLLPTGL